MFDKIPLEPVIAIQLEPLSYIFPIISGRSQLSGSSSAVFACLPCVTFVMFSIIHDCIKIEINFADSLEIKITNLPMQFFPDNCAFFTFIHVY